eukprot:353529-Chlamydomonas_euryale.AAC.9
MLLPPAPLPLLPPTKSPSSDRLLLAPRALLRLAPKDAASSILLRLLATDEASSILLPALGPCRAAGRAATSTARAVPKSLRCSSDIATTGAATRVRCGAASMAM